MHTDHTDKQWNETSGWRMDAAARVLSDRQIDEIRKNLEHIHPVRNADNAHRASGHLA